jgi:serine carboxypeptidase-like clade 2
VVGGCSSLDGLFYEQGPLLVSSDGKTLVRNPHSWATQANMLYLEAPCGVGFSYSPDKADYVNDDNGTAWDNVHALEAARVRV